MYGFEVIPAEWMQRDANDVCSCMHDLNSGTGNRKVSLSNVGTTTKNYYNV